MVKRIFSFLCALTICFGIIQTRCAAAEVDQTRPCSLTLSYTRGTESFAGLTIDIYRVAELNASGESRLLEPFSGYPIKIHGITSQREWQETAQTIKSYVVANQVSPYQTQVTDAEGYATFEGLETGLYMVKGAMAQNESGVFVFHDFMVYLPTPANGIYNYDVEAKPKYTEYTQPAQYTVIKLWKDSVAPAQRPESICVEILKDGVVQERITLSSANNWTYSWEATDSDSVWSVIEQDVPDGYQVSITNTGNSFIITNTMSASQPGGPGTPNPPDRPGESSPPSPEPSPSHAPIPSVPKTGDTTPLLWYVILLCISGFGLMLLGALNLRDRKHEKKR